MGRLREKIRRIKSRKTWVNPTGWGMNKGKLIILTGGFYLLALITILNGGIKGSIVFTAISIFLTLLYLGTERQLRNRFKDIEERFRPRKKDKG